MFIYCLIVRSLTLFLALDLSLTVARCSITGERTVLDTDHQLFFIPFQLPEKNLLNDKYKLETKRASCKI